MEIKIPEIGESVREALLAKWFKKTGDFVKRDEPVCEIETDKITLDLNADASGVLIVKVLEGATIPVGTVIAIIEESTVEPPAPVAAVADTVAGRLAAPPTSPALRREMREHDIDAAEIAGSGAGGRITQQDIFNRLAEKANEAPPSRPATFTHSPIPAYIAAEVEQPLVTGLVVSEPAVSSSVHSEIRPEYSAAREERRPMSPIRRRIAERLVAARQETAMLTTFNEIDMFRLQELRSSMKELSLQKYGIAPGYMPFFIKAVIGALKAYPLVNASIDGNDIVLHNYYDIGVAVGSEKGLSVPVVRNADNLMLHEIERSIVAYADKIKSNQLQISDLEGGTFTISNGGVYGSMLSTPLLNPPQSAILGMHAIKDRPVVVENQVVIRPVMYVALSYDHRVIDGMEAVGFLKKIKDIIETADFVIE